jgi:hypothetical protein
MITKRGGSAAGLHRAQTAKIQSNQVLTQKADSRGEAVFAGIRHHSVALAGGALVMVHSKVASLLLKL